MHTFGLIGYPLGHSFSKAYFTQKFRELGLSAYRYELFELPNISDFPQLWSNASIQGLNVTIPHKQAIIPYLDALAPSAKATGAVNVIQRVGSKSVGHNTDAFGFDQSLSRFLQGQQPHGALVLGKGGAAKAVMYVLGQRNIPYRIVSRTPAAGEWHYKELSEEILNQYPLIINTTPLGMYPKTEAFPEIPYQYLNQNHWLFDLVYNPTETAFMLKGEANGAQVCNGLAMLYAQAEKAWEIWQSEMS
ncbi:shikimate dehydrogenase [Cytophagales bacterium LB-30]|uniref:Shikimate dehydrogenase n=1 Tax=Shiella aurantiaca TaxID=3058365 RepID=A0ABT8F982_9BACT|nr:shikimate dehydrogenase [Shiella aurantiaca]MDN4166814.1 shikimate dehydrogenase [Shiella aurantiaca]